MIHLANYLDLKNIILLENSKKEEILNLLLEQVKYHPYLLNYAQFKEQIFEKEKELSTAVGESVAIPHAKSHVVKDFFITMAILKKEIVWNSSNAKIQIIFLIGGPDNDHNTYLSLVACVMLLAKNKKIKQALIESNSPEEVMMVIQNFMDWKH